MTNEPEPTRTPDARRVVLDPDGPILIEGPVEVVLPGGRVVSSDRFMVALCGCRRSRAYPWCDTSHRHGRHRRRPGSRQAGSGQPESGRSSEERPDSHA